jgi:hypothetical protein
MPAAKKNRAPRLDPYQRLVNRFYEPLILLCALGKTRGEHVAGSSPSSLLQRIRRRFFMNLSYCSDYTKGGVSTSSIAIEECDDCIKIWIASNQPSTKIVDFIGSILKDLELISKSGPGQLTEQEFVRKCIAFAKSRISKEASLLSRTITRCTTYLGGQVGSEGTSTSPYILDQTFLRAPIRLSAFCLAERFQHQGCCRCVREGICVPKKPRNEESRTKKSSRKRRVCKKRRIFNLPMRQTHDWTIGCPC